MLDTSIFEMSIENHLGTQEYQEVIQILKDEKNVKEINKIRYEFECGKEIKLTNPKNILLLLENIFMAEFRSNFEFRSYVKSLLFKLIQSNKISIKNIKYIGYYTWKNIVLKEYSEDNNKLAYMTNRQINRFNLWEIISNICSFNMFKTYDLKLFLSLIDIIYITVDFIIMQYGSDSNIKYDKSTNSTKLIMDNETKIIIKFDDNKNVIIHYEKHKEAIKLHSIPMFQYLRPLFMFIQYKAKFNELIDEMIYLKNEIEQYKILDEAKNIDDSITKLFDELIDNYKQQSHGFTYMTFNTVKKTYAPYPKIRRRNKVKPKLRKRNKQNTSKSTN